MMNNFLSPTASPNPTRTSSGRRRDQTPSSVDRDQAMRDYKLTIEYKHLKLSCPGGVYLVPSFDDLRLFHGVIFIRRGIFMNGIFKFTLECAPKYNDVNLHPKVTFSSYVYNPLVHPETGEVDLRMAYPRWDPNMHYLITVLTYIKRIFYIKEYSDLSAEEESFPNPESLRLFKMDQEGYRRRVQECVRESQRSVFLNNPGCTIRFNEEDKCQEIFRDLMKKSYGENDDSVSLDDISRRITLGGILDNVENAQQLVLGENRKR